MWIVARGKKKRRPSERAPLSHRSDWRLTSSLGLCPSRPCPSRRDPPRLCPWRPSSCHPCPCSPSSSRPCPSSYCPCPYPLAPLNPSSFHLFPSISVLLTRS